MGAPVSLSSSTAVLNAVNIKAQLLSLIGDGDDLKKKCQVSSDTSWPLDQIIRNWSGDLKDDVIRPVMHL